MMASNTSDEDIQSPGDAADAVERVAHGAEPALSDGEWRGLAEVVDYLREVEEKQTAVRTQNAVAEGQLRPRTVQLHEFEGIGHLRVVTDDTDGAWLIIHVAEGEDNVVCSGRLTAEQRGVVADRLHPDRDADGVVLKSQTKCDAVGASAAVGPAVSLANWGRGGCVVLSLVDDGTCNVTVRVTGHSNSVDRSPREETRISCTLTFDAEQRREAAEKIEPDSGAGGDEDGE